MTYTAAKSLTFEDFLSQYGEDPRYELADGELIDMEPTGSHETVSGKVATQIGREIINQQLSWVIPRTCLIRPLAGVITARRPDIVVLDETVLPCEPLWEKEPTITLGGSIALVVEVVSSNWENDYARKVEEYALLGIPEYWIVDYRGLGGIAFIGRPKQPTFTICKLMGEDYSQQQFRLGQSIISPSLPHLKFCLENVLPR